MVKELFQFNYDVNHNYNLRNRVTDLILPQPRKEFGKMRFSCSGAAHWNSLPYEAKTTPTVQSFKTTIKQ